MNRANLGQTIQTLANLGVLAGIAFLAFELKEMNRAAQLETAENHAERANAIDRLIFDNPGLREYQNPQNLDACDPSRDAIVTQLVYLNRMMLRSWQTTYYEYSRGVLDDSFFDLFVNEVQQELRFNDGLVNSWSSAGQTLYGSEFLDFLNDQLELARPEYEPNGPPNFQDRPLCE